MAYEDFLFELGTEELPPASLKALSETMLANFKEQLTISRIEFKTCKAFATPRRLAIFVESLATVQSGVDIEKKGPSLQSAFTKDNKPTKAALGFAKSCNVSVESLNTLKNEHGSWLIYKTTETGKKTKALIPDIVTLVINQLPNFKKMRWGSNLHEFIRPVQWVLMIMGDQILPFAAFGLQAENKTYGHRIHNSEPIIIKKPNEYEQKLKDSGFVIASFEDRKKEIIRQVNKLCFEVNANAVMHPPLLDEVTSLVEWPQAILGEFDENFLNLPSEVLITSMQDHQKYFPLKFKDDRLMARFIHVSNLNSSNALQVKQGIERVIRPRFEDASFFFETDKQTSLQDKRERLKNIVFQNRLGSIFDKTERVSNLSVLIADDFFTHNKEKNRYLTAYAGHISRSDLVTEMVTEFPDLQGIMGKYYAQAEGKNDNVCISLEEMYLPRFSGDKLPTTAIGCILSVADKIDTLVGILGIGLKPSGKKDPYALRRIALGCLKVIIDKELQFDIKKIIEWSISEYQKQDIDFQNSELDKNVCEFIFERMRYWCISENLSANNFLAVSATQNTKPYDFFLRILAVDYFFKHPSSSSLSEANKRVKNILSKVKNTDIPSEIKETLFNKTAERNLFEVVEKKHKDILSKVTNQLYQEVLQDLIELKEPLDRFFDEVMVNVEDENIRANRYAILNKLRNLFLQIADISYLC